MKSHIIFLGLLLLCPIFGNSQNNNQQLQSIDSVNLESFNPNEAHSFKEWFQKGHTSGIIRANMMHTLRPKAETYNGALALGGRLYYHTSYWKGLKLGVGGLFTYNVASTNLASNNYMFAPKWERQLFDLQDPVNKHDLDRLEELFVKYRHKDSYIKLGKMLVETPFVNPQDSRMKPSAFQGLWIDWNEGHRLELNGGIFNKVSPRSTTEWIGISESIGLYERYQKGDTSSPIHENINLWILGAHYKINSNMNYHNWQYYISQFSYVNFNQLEWRKSPIQIGIQYVFQKGLDKRQLFSKMPAKQNTSIMSGQVKWIAPKWQISYNITQGLSDTPFIFSKEWGNDPFYTYISRHRIEGLNGVNSHSIKLNLQPFNNWKDFNLGVYGIRTAYEEVDVLLNNSTDSYLNQLSLDMQAHFSKHWENLSFRFLNTILIAKGKVINPFLKEEIFHSQLIVNYNF
ncbi:OprD family outer membrane porin [Marivirga sp. S37H4]|uniref:OprD family outer membrane porin n=1 Tax=Marivirga aurantiaca TaxID=2802615 RepID=A0A934WV75_9BACT|nr:OprD family outer membrane porin [Marivirga aurantiaca]MBK6263550.1 OprD family outer membrane porin [Marivirga aurantiaca]